MTRKAQFRALAECPFVIGEMQDVMQMICRLVKSHKLAIHVIRLHFRHQNVPPTPRYFVLTFVKCLHYSYVTSPVKL